MIKEITAFLFFAACAFPVSAQDNFSDGVPLEEQDFYNVDIPAEIPAGTPSYSVSPATDAASASYYDFITAVSEEYSGNFKDALDNYRRTIAYDPDNEYLYKQALSLALESGLTDDAGKWAEFLVEKDSSSAENWVLFGNTKWASGDKESAAKAYEKALAIDPKNYEAVYQYASVISQEDQDTAVHYLEKYVKLRPDDAPEINYRIAVLYNMKGDLAKTEQYLKKSAAGDSFYTEPRYMLGELYELRKDTAAALSTYLDLLPLDTRNPELTNRIADYYLNTQYFDVKKAEKYLRMWVFRSALHWPTEISTCLSWM